VANEARVTAGLLIKKGSTDYQARPSTFIADVDEALAKGPVPGAFTVTKQGVACDLAELVNPGLCRIANLESKTSTPNRVVEYGIADPQRAIFYPLGEVKPGESYVLRLGRNLRGEYGTAAGTAALTGESNQLWFRSLDPSGADAQVKVEAFET
jgi:hypothetical protein